MHSVSRQGADIPVLGFGTYGMGGQELLRVLGAALASGFRHIDTAQIYRNEAVVGEAVALSGLPRSEVFITTKVWVDSYSPNRFAASVDESLVKLRTDYVDLLLLHWPTANSPSAELIGALNAVVQAGKTRHIGVSNFNSAQMVKAASLSATPLVTNQVEYHPYLNQGVLLDAARKAGISITAYCGMAIGRVFTDGVLAAIAGRHRRSIAQIVLRWLIQQGGVVALSRTTNISRVSENAAVFDFELSPDEMATIHSLASPGSRIVDPPGLAPIWDRAL